MNDTQTTPETGDAASIRRMHLNHEANIKAIGMLYYIGVFSTLLVFALWLTGTIKLDKLGIRASAVEFSAAVAVFYIWVAHGLRALDPGVKIPAGILAGIGLLGFPIGTLINGFVLYLLFSKKGAMVFSDEYKQVIAATPHIKYRTSIIVWFFVALLVLLILLGVAAVLSHH